VITAPTKARTAGAAAPALACALCDTTLNARSVCRGCHATAVNNAYEEGETYAEDGLAGSEDVSDWLKRARLLLGMPEDVAKWFERCIKDLEDARG
jgi:hypothetical protein